ncbi:MAG: Sec-independent protein translocase protein TatB, partial [Pseudomonadota bacterium]
MFGIGMPELLIILVVALIVVGPKKLPDMAKGLGKGLSQFRKAADEIKEEFSEHETYQDLKSLNKSFRDTLDEVNPRKLLDDVNPLVEAKEPTLDLSGRDALMKEIKQQTEDPKEQATVEVAQPEDQPECGVGCGRGHLGPQAADGPLVPSQPVDRRTRTGPWPGSDNQAAVLPRRRVP